MFGSRIREWGPLDWCVALVVVLALVAGGILGARKLMQKCDGGLHEVAGECVGVTEESFDADPGIDSLLQAVADENSRVADEGGETPYVRLALMMPFTSDDNSAMTPDMIRRALAGALAGLQEANSGQGGPQFQLLLAPDGRNLGQWKPVVDALAKKQGDSNAPLVGVTGIPSSQTETQAALDELSDRQIPAVGPVITASSMNYPYFFKTSPNNKEFAKALAGYLKRYPQKKNGLLLWDRRQGDVYSDDLRHALLGRFGKEYGFKAHNSSFTGSSGNDQGVPQLFYDAVNKICRDKSDTVFFAGRDQDLPAFINALAGDSSCDRKTTVRILKIGIGLEPTLTTEQTERDLRTANATIVDSSSFDPAWEKQGARGRPTGIDDFLDRFDALKTAHTLGEKPLDDGYAASYYDGVRLLTQATGRSFSQINAGKATKRLPTAKDVYNNLSQSTSGGTTCAGCLQGATGTYGFSGLDRNDQWSACKPVPVVEFPPSKRQVPLYRTYEDDGACPG